ncbi:phospholipase/carboxylesterase [Sulfurivirga caldicuralii]|uniref:Phospholipase/carboxylesterase n=1 Tax=Sulfurivirga caldicuralii TaxID=364032 RepID=A0A1N6GLZ2_9GAMM|nr:dienelactone hydrolase family protein [Sulfurivirga caldicuralii]SIO08533.1 phospholipase/carboxylesterase [Sulfurivirga caldicuralii]
MLQPSFDKPPIIIEPPQPPRAACIWLHGLGADGHDFEPVVHMLQLPVSVRFVLPHAPVQPVTINGGLPMRAWFDIRSLQLDEDVDIEGINGSSAAVAELARAQNLPVVLAGFSQGGLIALHAALQAGAAEAVMALSTWYPFTPPTTALPVFMAHGTADEIVPLSLAEESAARLEAAGAQVDWHTWPMGHTVIPEEIAALNQWLNRKLEALDG